MSKPKITAPQAYESPRCDTMDMLSTGVLCASENGTITDLNDNDWGGTL